MSIGKNIMNYRKAKGLTQEELGELLGVSNQAVSKWETEMTLPDVMRLPKIASVLGIDLQVLYDVATGEERHGTPKEVMLKKDRKILNISYQDAEINAKVKIPIEALKAAIKLGVSDEKDAKEMAPFLEFLENDMDIEADIPGGHATVTVKDYEY